MTRYAPVCKSAKAGLVDAVNGDEPTKRFRVENGVNNMKKLYPAGTRTDEAFCRAE